MHQRALNFATFPLSSLSIINCYSPGSALMSRGHWTSCRASFCFSRCTSFSMAFFCFWFAMAILLFTLFTQSELSSLPNKCIISWRESGANGQCHCFLCALFVTVSASFPPIT